MKFSKKVDALVKKGIPLREIRKSILHGRKGEGVVSNIIIGVVVASTALIIFLLSSPLLKEIISSATSGFSPIVRFFAVLIPFITLLLLVVFLISAFKGGYSDY